MQTAKLRAKIAENGSTQGAVAKSIGISENTFSAKISGKRPFYVEEAQKICDLLGVCDDAERAKIFLR